MGYIQFTKASMSTAVLSSQGAWAVGFAVQEGGDWCVVPLAMLEAGNGQPGHKSEVTGT